MQLFLSFLISLNLFSFNAFENTGDPVNTNESTVVIEIVDADKIPFDFTMKYNERRKIIKIRSAEPIKSLRTVETASNSHKGYNVMGSDLIILPQRDFNPGSYVVEIKFVNNPAVVVANMHIVETPVADGE